MKLLKGLVKFIFSCIGWFFFGISTSILVVAIFRFIMVMMQQTQHGGFEYEFFCYVTIGIFYAIWWRIK